jgi:hypothetical protein
VKRLSNSHSPPSCDHRTPSGDSFSQINTIVKAARKQAARKQAARKLAARKLIKTADLTIP